MNVTQAEDVIKTVISEVVRKCSGEGHTLSETLVAFMVKAVILDPRNQFNVERRLTDQDVQKLVKLCVGQLLTEGNPTLDTIKMQEFFDTHYTSRDEFVDYHQQAVQDRVQPLCQEITDRQVWSREELQSLYHKIISYMLVGSMMGSPTDLHNVRETSAALQSVFPQSELGTFMCLSKQDKEQQLKEICLIVAGIRLYSKDCQKGGEAIEDLCASLNEVLPTIRENIESQLHTTQTTAYKYTALLENQGPLEEDSSVSADLLKQALYNVRQHEVFLKLILADITVCTTQVESLQADLQTQMETLKSVINTRTAIPSGEVFPLFTAIAMLWSCLHDEKVLLVYLNEIVNNLQPFLASQSQAFPPERLDALLGGVQVKSDEQRTEESAETAIDPAEFTNQEWLFPETMTDFSKVPLQYRGMCGYTLLTNGVLIPGNPKIGILKHKDKHYVFSSKDAAVKFAKKPDDNIESIAERAKLSPEIIQLVELHQQFGCVTPYSELLADEQKPVVKHEIGVQTDTHVVESNIVKDYEWNEWELRRKAIKLVNLRTKVTHSMQTNWSHMKRENATQIYLPKDAWCQTKKDGSSNVPKPQVFLAGLRNAGGPRTHETKINLTRPIVD